MRVQARLGLRSAFRSSLWRRWSALLTFAFRPSFTISCSVSRGPAACSHTLARRSDVATMQAVMLTKKGGPEVLEAVELPLPEPGPGEVRVRIRATGVGATDIAMRRGSAAYVPPIPFVPGYE